MCVCVCWEGGGGGESGGRGLLGVRELRLGKLLMKYDYFPSLNTNVPHTHVDNCSCVFIVVIYVCLSLLKKNKKSFCHFKLKISKNVCCTAQCSVCVDQKIALHKSYYC